MSADKHTPGSWRWLSGNALVGDHGHRPVVLMGSELRQRCADGRTQLLDVDSPDARLIEAAPDLFDGLDQLLAEVLGDMQALACVDLRIIDRCKAALARARGGA